MRDDSALMTDRLLTWMDRRRYWVGMVVIAIYGLAFNGQWRPGPDSAEHVSIADRLIQGQGFTHPTGWEAHLSPGLAYLLAAVGWAWGQVSFTAALAVMLLMSLATLGLVFVLVRIHFGRPTAVVITAMLALTETYCRLSYELLTDMPFCFGLMLFLLGWTCVVGVDREREESHGLQSMGFRGLCLLIVGVGVMTLFRSVVLTVLIGVALTVMMQRGRGFVALMVSFGSWFVAQWINGLIGAATPAAHDGSRAITLVLGDLPGTLWRVLSKNLPKLAGESTSEALFAVDAGPVIGVGVTLVVLAIGVRLWQVHRMWAMLALTFFVQWLLVLPGDRYFLPILLPLAVGWWMSAVWLERRGSGKAVRVMVVVMLVGWIGPNLVYVGKLVLEQRRRPFLEQYEKGKFAALQMLGEQIREHVTEDDLVVGANGQVLTWYSDRKVMDPKRLRLIARWDKQAMADYMRPHSKLYIIQPPDAGQRRLMRRLPVMLGEPIAIQERFRGAKGREPWTLCPAKLEKKYRRAITDPAVKARAPGPETRRPPE